MDNAKLKFHYDHVYSYQGITVPWFLLIDLADLCLVPVDSWSWHDGDRDPQCFHSLEQQNKQLSQELTQLWLFLKYSFLSKAIQKFMNQLKIK